MQSLKLARKNGFVNAQQNSNENSKIRFLKLLLQPILKIFFYLQMLLRLSLIKKYESVFSRMVQSTSCGGKPLQYTENLDLNNLSVYFSLKTTSLLGDIFIRNN